MGPSIATEVILNSKLKDEFELIHLDLSDRRDLNTLGVIDYQNIFLALKHYLMLLWLIVCHRTAMVYLPINQTTIGYLRDSGFIVIAKLFRRKVVCHLRGGNFRNWYNSSHCIMRWFARSIHSFVDAQIVLGETLKHLFEGIIANKRIFVVPNARDFTISPHSKRHFGKLTILYLANFIRSKGVLDCLHATELVCNSRFDVEFIFSGKWREKSVREEFEAFLVQHPDLPVILKGPVYDREKYRLFCDSDIFVFPTYYPAEGHPWVIVEAMAFGLPIITTDQGCIKESVLDKVNGFIVEKQSSRQIADKIMILIKDSKLRAKMGGMSRKLYLEKFSEDQLVSRMSKVFNEVL